MQLRETILYRYHASHSDKVVLKIILQSAYQNGWDSNEIVGHRDLEIGAGKWHRLISSIRGYVDTSNQGTRIINGTLREFYAELEAGKVEIG